MVKFELKQFVQSAKNERNSKISTKKTTNNKTMIELGEFVLSLRRWLRCLFSHDLHLQSCDGLFCGKQFFFFWLTCEDNKRFFLFPFLISCFSFLFSNKQSKNTKTQEKQQKQNLESIDSLFGRVHFW